jgi:hypothetical protein
MDEETKETLIVIFYSGTKGCEDYKVVNSWYKNVGCEKPSNLLEIAMDRHPSVHDLDLKPQRKLFLTSPDATIGGQLTPYSSIAVFEYNRRQFHQIMNDILEHARKIRAREIRFAFLFTCVGGTGFTTSLRLALTIKNQLTGRIPVSIIFLGTAPPLDMTESPENATDAVKLANTECALRTLVAVAPAVDLAFIRFPTEVLPSEPRVAYLLRSLGLLPTK